MCAGTCGSCDRRRINSTSQRNKKAISKTPKPNVHASDRHGTTPAVADAQSWRVLNSPHRIVPLMADSLPKLAKNLPGNVVKFPITSRMRCANEECSMKKWPK